MAALAIPLPLLLLLVLTRCSSAAIDPGADGDELLMLTVLTRHGDRASQEDSYITKLPASIVFFRGHGELSDDGLKHGQETGQAYADRYKGFLNPRFDPREAHFKSSAVNRVLMTAGAMASGMFRSSLRPVHVPIYAAPYNEDPLLAIQFDCRDGWEDQAVKYSIESTSDMPNRILDAMRRDQWECTDPPATQSDTLLAEEANAFTRAFLSQEQRECAANPAKRFMYSYIEALSGSGSSYNHVRFQRTVGNLANMIVDQFKDKFNCQNKTIVSDVCANLPKANFLHAHDVNTLGLLNAFSNQHGARAFFDGLTPSYAASVAIELMKRDGQPIVKISVKNGASEDFRPFPYCQYLPADWARVRGECTLDSFEQAKDLYVGREQASCFRKSCCTADGVWSEWTPTAPCPSSCGSCSNSTRRRMCLSEEDGCPCRGEANDIGPCGIGLCPKPVVCCAAYTKSMNGQTHTSFCGTGDVPAQAVCDPARCCPQGGIWTEWATSGTCSSTCGSCSTRTRTRSCVSAKDGCPCSGASTETGACGTAPCPPPAAECCKGFAKKMDYQTGHFFCGTEDNGALPDILCCPDNSNTYWSAWSEWSSTCLTTGGRSRTRICYGADKGCKCDGESSESEACCCPPGGVWSEWSPDGGDCIFCGACEITSRKRTCESEKFDCPCTGDTSDSGPCDRTPCNKTTVGYACCEGSSVMTNPNTGVDYCGTNETEVPLSGCCSTSGSSWNEWYSWSGNCLSANCGLCGRQSRHRSCDFKPIGCPCVGPDSQSEACGSNEPCLDPEKECCEPHVKTVIDGQEVCQ